MLKWVILRSGLVPLDRNAVVAGLFIAKKMKPGTELFSARTVPGRSGPPPKAIARTRAISSSVHVKLALPEISP